MKPFCRRRDGQRVIYTSPLKALSNQKYRELAEEFRDVGEHKPHLGFDAAPRAVLL